VGLGGGSLREVEEVEVTRQCQLASGDQLITVHVHQTYLSPPILTSKMVISNYRDIERSPVFLVLQTPSKCFRHCSLPMVM